MNYMGEQKGMEFLDGASDGNILILNYYVYVIFVILFLKWENIYA